MEVPPGFSSKVTEGKFYKLEKALYGLKQSPTAVWSVIKCCLSLNKQSHAILRYSNVL